MPVIDVKIRNIEFPPYKIEQILTTANARLAIRSTGIFKPTIKFG
jgi:hypothetical protein